MTQSIPGRSQFRLSSGEHSDEYTHRNPLSGNLKRRRGHAELVNLLSSGTRTEQPPPIGRRARIRGARRSTLIIPRQYRPAGVVIRLRPDRPRVATWNR